MLKRMSLCLVAALTMAAASLAVAAPMDPGHMLTAVQVMPAPAS